MNVIRVVHLEAGLPNPLENNWQLKCVLKGLQRAGSGTRAKLPITPSHLRAIRGCLDMGTIADKQFWAATLLCFFGLLRISNVTTSHAVSWKADHTLTRADCFFMQNGVILQSSSALVKKHSVPRKGTNGTSALFAWSPIVPYVGPMQLPRGCRHPARHHTFAFLQGLVRCTSCVNQRRLPQQATPRAASLGHGYCRLQHTQPPKRWGYMAVDSGRICASH